MEKKNILFIFLISAFLSGCGQKDVSELTTFNMPITQEEQEGFDSAYKDFINSTATLREVIEEEKQNSTDNVTSNIDNTSYEDGDKNKSVEQLEYVENSVPNIKNQTEDNIDVNFYFLDVGQGDSTLIESDGQYMLIDSGDYYACNKLLNLIKEKTNTLEYVVATHPHSDHIANIDNVLESFEVKHLIYKDIDNPNSTCDDDLREAIRETNVEVIEPVVGTEYELGKAKFTVLGPNSDKYENLNDFSIPILFSYNDISCLFTGDMEGISEVDLMKTKANIDCTILKVSNHGSETSSTNKFLEATTPQISVISCGKDNDYGLPKGNIVSKIESYGSQIYRTDIDGNITIGTNGTNVYVLKEKAYKEVPLNDIQDNAVNNTNYVYYPEDVSTYVVYKTAIGDKYHMEGCGQVNKSSKQITVAIAKELGLKPCEKCCPPR